MCSNVFFRLLNLCCSFALCPSEIYEVPHKFILAITMSHASRAHNGLLMELPTTYTHKHVFYVYGIPPRHQHNIVLLGQGWLHAAKYKWKRQICLDPVYSTRLPFASFFLFETSPFCVGVTMPNCGCVDEKSLKFEVDKRLRPVSHSGSYRGRIQRHDLYPKRIYIYLYISLSPILISSFDFK